MVIRGASNMSAYYNEEFIDNLSADPVDGLLSIIDHFHEQLRNTPNVEKGELTLEAYCIIQQYREAHNITITELPPAKAWSSDYSQMTKLIANAKNQLDQIGRVREAESETDRAAALVNRSFTYEFTDGDFAKIQALINEMRDIVSESQLFGARHKQRVLERLEKLQREVHKRMTRLDSFWALLPEYGIAIGKFGNDIKPFTDRVIDLGHIFWRAEARRAELPSDSQSVFLPRSDEVQDSDEEG